MNQITSLAISYPPEISRGINLVTSSIGKLEKDGRNEFGKGYNYTSIDGFLSAVGPACAEAGLIIKPVCIKIERVHVTVADKDGKPKEKIILDCVYKMRLIDAQTGITFTDEEDLRYVSVDWTGPQSYMGAESFALKAYQRTLFQIATGDPDPDASEQHEAEIIKAKVKTSRANNETGENHIPFDFGEGLKPISVKELPDKIKEKIKKLGDKTDISAWLETNKLGREQLNIQAPNQYHELRKWIEAHIRSLSQKQMAENDLLAGAAE